MYIFRDISLYIEIRFASQHGADVVSFALFLSAWIHYVLSFDRFERGMSADRLEAIFAQITDPLRDLLRKVTKALPTAPSVHEALRGGEQWDVKQQADFCKKVRVLTLT